MSVTQKTIRLFVGHAWRYPRLLVPLLLIMPFNILASDFLLPYIASQVLQKISQGAFDPHQIWASFGGYIVVYAIAAASSGIVGWRIAIWLVWNLELKTTRDIAQRIFNHLMSMSPNFHANRFGGSLVSQANKLTGAYIRFADATLFNMYTLTIALIATISILAPRVPVYAAMLLLLSIIYIAGAIYFSRSVREANTREAEAQSKQTGVLADSITNIMAVKSFARREHESQRYWKSATHTLEAGRRSIHATTIRETYASVVTTTLNVSALVIAVVSVGYLNIDIATVFLIVSYTGNIGMRLWDFQNVLRQYNRAIGDASDMVKILDIAPGIKDPDSPQSASISKGAITFEHVDFTHAGAHKNQALFANLDLRIKAGEKVGLVGHSGSGKTTLTRILLRFSDLDGGKILIDDQDIATITQDDLRRHISYVPQEPLLFHRSIRENIAYGKPDATDQEIAEAAKKAYAHEFIESLPDGYQTLVGERGVKLSGGQRQRIVIARAILKDAPILVLDEATSALDSESERLIQAALQELMKKRTAIVIAHRLSTVQRMDRIIVLDHGKIVEQGSHRELVDQGGRYAELWSHQSGGFIDD
jgi:ATP-binding cassette, subfamily B, bacterial